MWCFVSWRRSFRATLATIWMCTQEWSLIRKRTTAFTLDTCHHPLSSVSSLTRSSSRLSLRLPRTGTLIFICLTASAGVSRVSRSASSETGCSIRSSVSLSRAIRVLGHVCGPVSIERRIKAPFCEQLVVRPLLDDPAVLQHDDQVGIPNRRQPVRDDEGRSTGEQEPQRPLDLALGADVDRRSGLVEDEETGIGKERARQRDELPLAEREA